MNTNSNPLPIRVIKLGGSLLTFPKLPRHLIRWLTLQPSLLNVVVVGGGTRVRQLRTEQAQRQLNDEQAHFEAIQIMHDNGRWLQAKLFRLTHAVMVDCWASMREPFESLTHRSQTEVMILDPRDWCRKNDTLTRNWQTTSDSIAAAMAVDLRANELVLLKSELPDSACWSDIAAAGFVDPEFLKWAPSIPVCRIVNLRSEVFCERAAHLPNHKVCLSERSPASPLARGTTRS
jgi:5-(aminomethyl)-3-furanmethanol phosphate kinase